MHLVPTDRADRRIIEGERVCAAIGGIGDADFVAAWAAMFAVLGDPSRLTLLLAIHHAGPISVSDLAVAADMNDTTVSQALRLLKAGGIVASQRDGRIIRYHLVSEQVIELLDRLPRSRLPTRVRPGSRGSRGQGADSGPDLTLPNANEDAI
jgi:ArsR family transcriptional regulator, lead/cadmium/zinc/bismuth-responsive transcriptional repressor